MFIVCYMYQEHYLPYIIQSKLKLWCLEGSDRGLDGFLEKSFQNESSRLILQSRYAEQVAMAYIVKGDLGKAKYYHNLSLTSFQQVGITQCIIRNTCITSMYCILYTCIKNSRKLIIIHVLDYCKHACTCALPCMCIH